ncbi:hypothetical protein PGT21_034568 [Puccinia graminis f. sp. tritici]|uniref:Secreted protein n=1 Tax=Puccinia graminis f. sp. tritici TaxID=56615 RepID=A0A5B0RC96_PUCGR|nr:hypothetical protein PGT21_034568 [Puccinia graminis f. sp. tritici]KAA1109465.1 hypothetical protein PGTUg99_034083 [Puccinia graminis f. sp. tritici]KAA1123002.1 hypothetical protein PGTUg99_001291 [Puccinia graminis f. sp. tritici]KAA1126405.1 hypothetical protein PGTUg99_031139 [Puccinia graminis f. sp. tritici]KAA1127545.1 hypothetical protein PGTUg99_037588 [Puccinia graminis f. sp. tritici]
MQLLQLSIFTLAAVLVASLHAEGVTSEIGSAEHKLVQAEESVGSTAPSTHNSHEKRGLEKRKKKKGGGRGGGAKKKKA